MKHGGCVCVDELGLADVGGATWVLGGGAGNASDNVVGRMYVPFGGEKSEMGGAFGETETFDGVGVLNDRLAGCVGNFVDWLVLVMKLGTASCWVEMRDADCRTKVWWTFSPTQMCNASTTK